MSELRPFWRSAVVAAGLGLVMGVLPAAAQEVTVQQLYERGALQEAVQRAEGDPGNPEATYFAAQAWVKMNDNDRAMQEYAHLVERGDESWKAIGESGRQLMAGDLDAAMHSAERAVNANQGNPYAHYQVGAVASRQSNFERAANEFARAVELKPDFAYAHYYAGLAYQRQRQTAKMSEHLEAFMRLAPEAPERNAVAAILRTLRPR